MNLSRMAIMLLLTVGTFVLTGCSSVSPTVKAIGSNIASIFKAPVVIENRITNPVRVDAGLAVLWVGHATVLMQIDDKFILTDPHFGKASGLFSKRRIEAGIAVENLPMLDAVLISHMHIDHLSLASLDAIEEKTGMLIIPQGGFVYIPNFDFDMRELSTWQSWQRGGLRITAAPVMHNGWRYGLDDAWMKTSFTSYIIEYNGITVFFSGDTGYRRGAFEEIGRRWKNIDLAILPIAPIHPRSYSRERHTDPEDALNIYNEIGARRMLPIHYDTFPESLDTLGEARAEMVRAMQRRSLTGDQVLLLGIGEQKTVIQRKTKLPLRDVPGPGGMVPEADRKR